MRGVPIGYFAALRRRGRDNHHFFQALGKRNPKASILNHINHLPWRKIEVLTRQEEDEEEDKAVKLENGVFIDMLNPLP